MKKSGLYIKGKENSKGILLFLFIFLMTLGKTILFNPDTDAYFLIENGRYLMENEVPFISPWFGNNDFQIIIQQPVCSLLNYFCYKLGGLNSLWILAMGMNLVLLTAVYRFCSLFFSESKERIACLTVMELLIFGMGITNTRPYQITIAISLTELAILFLSYEKKKKCFSVSDTYKETAKLTFQLSVLTFIQANYQISFLIMLFLWPLCFIAPDIRKLFLLKEKGYSYKQFIKESIASLLSFLPVYMGMSLSALCNPYGWKGICYLFLSKPAMDKMGNCITEVVKPGIFSLNGILLLILFYGFIKYFWKLSTAVWYLNIGSLVLITLAYRNGWMGFPAFIIFLSIIYYDIFAKRKQTEKKQRINIIRMFYTAFLIFSVITVFSMISEKKNDNPVLELLDYIQTESPENRYYTTFNTGNLLEFAGYQIYMDARPELHTPEITKCEYNQLQEWMDLEINHKTNPVTFFTENDFTHIVIEKNDYLDLVIRYMDMFEPVFQNDIYIIYKVKK